MQKFIKVKRYCLPIFGQFQGKFCIGKCLQKLSIQSDPPRPHTLLGGESRLLPFLQKKWDCQHFINAVTLLIWFGQLERKEGRFEIFMLSPKKCPLCKAADNHCLLFSIRLRKSYYEDIFNNMLDQKSHVWMRQVFLGFFSIILVFGIACF